MIRIKGNNWRNGMLLGSMLLCALILALSPALAQSRSVTVLRDAETEAILRIFSEPIFAAAGLPTQQVDLILIQNDELNAFVAGGQNIFVYTGLILEAKTADELIGVLAHETGHIAGGHLIRTQDAVESASRQALLTTVLGLGAAVASGRGDVGFAAVTAGQNIAMSNILSHSRAQESAADAAALSYLDRAGLSSRGFLDFMRRLQDQDLLSSDRQSEYIRTHPLTRDRVEHIKAHYERSPLRDTDTPENLQRLHLQMQAKLTGYIKPRHALRIYKAEDQSRHARYGRAVAYWRNQQTNEALPLLDTLIAEEPDNPYYFEIKGQVLFEDGRILEALPPLRRAVELAPQSGLIRLGLGHALLETPRGVDEEETRMYEAIDVLLVAQQLEPRVSRIHRFLAQAYGRLENEARMRLHLAEEALLNRDLNLAISHANRALEAMAEDSRDRIRAEDIIAYAEQLR